MKAKVWMVVLALAGMMAACKSAQTDDAYNGYYIHNTSDATIRTYVKYIIPYRGGNTTTTTPEGDFKIDSIGAQYIEIPAQSTKMIQFYWTYGYPGLEKTSLPSQNFSSIAILSEKGDTLHKQNPVDNGLWDLVENRTTSMGKAVKYELTYPVSEYLAE